MAFAHFQRLALGCLISLGLSVTAHAATAIRVADFNDGPLFPADVFPEDLAPLDIGFLVSAVGAGPEGLEGERQMYFSDGTVDGTRPLLPGVVDVELAERIGPCQLWHGRPRFGPRRLWCTEIATGRTRALSNESQPAEVVGLLPSRRYVFWREGTGELGSEIWRGNGQPGAANRELVLVLQPRVSVRATAAAGARFLLALDNSNFVSQVEVWSSDGTDASKQFLLAPLTPTGFRMVGAETRAFVLGATLDRPNLERLWVTTGTQAGTVQLASFPTGQVTALVASGRRLYFARRTASPEAEELWTSDGTVAGTRRLLVRLGFGTAFSATGTQTLGARFVFVWNDNAFGTEPWVSDGTPSGTRRLADTCPGSCSGPSPSAPLPLTEGRVLFTAFDFEAGVELWSTNGAPSGTRRVLDLCPGSCSGAEGSVFAVDGTAFLFGHDGTNGIELWTSNGTARGTQRLSNLEPFFPFETQNFATYDGARIVTRLGNRTWFGAKGAAGSQLFVSDGPPSSTRVGLALGSTVAPGSSPTILSLGSKAAIVVNRPDPTRGIACVEPSGATRMLALPPETSVRRAVAEGGRVFFTAGQELWVTDCGQGDPVALTQLAGTGRAVVGFLLAAQEGGAAFLVEGGLPFWELWETDGTAAGTRHVADLPDGFSAGSFVAGERGYFFSAVSTPFSGFYALPRGGELQPILVGADCTAGFFDLREAFDHANETFLIWRRRRFEDGAIVGHGLVRSDGTSAGTECVPTDVFAPDDPSRPAWVRRGNEVFLTGLPLSSRRASLLKLNVAGDFEVPVELDAQESMSAPVLFGDRFAFLTGPEPLDPTNEVALWLTDGTADGTTRLAAGVQGSSLSLAAAGNRLLFSGCTPTEGCELWESDGTQAGTRRRQELRPGPGSSFPERLGLARLQLLFPSSDGVTGLEPWRLDVSPSAPACPASDTALCLGGGRFRAEVVWQDFAGNQGLGRAVALTPDSGAFWFFDPANLEAMTKVVDGTGLNERFWVFYGALTNVRYQLTVTDTANGNARRWSNLSGQFRSFADTNAFPAAGSLAGPANVVLQGESPLPTVETRNERASRVPCAPGPTRLCLLGGRFQAEVVLEDPNVPALTGQAVPWSPDAGFLWFFAADNLEVGVKMVDGRALNGKFWIFSASLSNLGYRLTVTDTETGASRTYRNRPGAFASFADTGAF
jgi:trimeric autotransporter adhesin